MCLTGAGAAVTGAFLGVVYFQEAAASASQPAFESGTDGSLIFFR